MRMPCSTAAVGVRTPTAMLATAATTAWGALRWEMRCACCVLEVVQNQHRHEAEYEGKACKLLGAAAAMCIIVQAPAAVEVLVLLPTLHKRGSWPLKKP